MYSVYLWNIWMQKRVCNYSSVYGMSDLKSESYFDQIYHFLSSNLSKSLNDQRKNHFFLFYCKIELFSSLFGPRRSVRMFLSEVQFRFVHLHLSYFIGFERFLARYNMGRNLIKICHPWCVWSKRWHHLGFIDDKAVGGIVCRHAITLTCKLKLIFA